MDNLDNLFSMFKPHPKGLKRQDGQYKTGWPINIGKRLSRLDRSSSGMKGKTTMTTTLDIAQAFSVQGVATFPVVQKSKKPAIMSWQPYQKQMPAQAELQQWFANTTHNIGVVCGWQGLTVIDFDSYQAYKRWQRWSAAQGGTAAAVAHSAYQVATSRGAHVYIRLDVAERNRALDGVDLKGLGGYVLGETSTHPSGVVYTRLSPGMLLPQVTALSDVLPADLLLSAPPAVAATAHVAAPVLPVAAAPADPWEAAAAPRSLGGPGMIDRIKARFGVKDFFTSYTSTSADSRYVMTQCPFHDDQRPSFWLDTTLNLCGCFAGCTRKALDVIRLFGRLYGLDNHSAIMALGKML